MDEISASPFILKHSLETNDSQLINQSQTVADHQLSSLLSSHEKGGKNYNKVAKMFCLLLINYMLPVCINFIYWWDHLTIPSKAGNKTEKTFFCTFLFWKYEKAFKYLYYRGKSKIIFKIHFLLKMSLLISKYAFNEIKSTFKSFSFALPSNLRSQRGLWNLSCLAEWKTSGLFTHTKIQSATLEHLQ